LPPASAGWDWAFARVRCLREARRIVRDSEAAEEVVQEALLRAWRHRDACRSRDDPVPWLLQITRNEAMRSLGRRPHRQECEVEESDAVEESRQDTVVENIALEQALSHLDPEERELIELRYVRDMTQPEVARTLRMPEGTVKVRLHRIRRRLRHDMEDQW
jgi:RNA polymerase sigma-70 factor, ECF subfamily